MGLRGAVPIIFATYPVVAGVEDSSLLFNIVFFVTLLSLVVQGTTVSLMAEWLGLAYPERERIFNDEVMNRMLDDATTELTVTEAMLEPGHHLRDIVLPAATLVVMVARDGTFFVPKGNSVLRVGDKLLVVTGRRTENPPLPQKCGRGGFPYGLVRLFGGGRSGTGLGGLQAAARGGGFPAGRRDACSREGRGGLSADDYAWRADSSRSRSAIEHPVASSRTSRW